MILRTIAVVSILFSNRPGAGFEMFHRDDKTFRNQPLVCSQIKILQYQYDSYWYKIFQHFSDAGHRDEY